MEELKTEGATAEELKRDDLEVEEWKKNSPVLILIRGVPGSGKSTLAKRLAAQWPDLVHLEADMYFVDQQGEYRWEPAKLGAAHDWCQMWAYSCMCTGSYSVVVSNTFMEQWELEGYVALAAITPVRHVIIHDCPLFSGFSNCHQVPSASVDRMRSKWQPSDKVVAALQPLYPALTFRLSPLKNTERATPKHATLPECAEHTQLESHIAREPEV
ncbi:putative kinase [Gregarina niphandrodes]|uniref:Kinase n=1 Tax=Gregarina niphandrodes TaxID=110365 RepID=A0A023B3B1_GRENI|nr:putative kinase [Gregarina niphandrodes]EZG55441.1 putative kinase [Gregarina niphandrodes]|eukprot:XP_011131552.1 putative kinase [Gregarina niphandrodes]